MELQRSQQLGFGVHRARAWRARVAFAGVVAFVAAAVLPAGAAFAEPIVPDARPGLSPPGRVTGVVVDPADYLSIVPDASELARKLVAQAVENSVNTIYLNAYNVEYGAYYRTAYRFNYEGPYGSQDLLGKLITAAHARGIRVFGAIYDHQHRGAWEANDSWRAKTASGKDYNPARTDIQYYLSVGHPSVQRWWRGFLGDLLARYPTLDGIEIREPIINWWGAEADHNPVHTANFRREMPGARVGSTAWRRYRQLTLSRFVADEIALIHARGLEVHLTTVADTWGDGRLLSASEEAAETGFDLDAILDAPKAERPDAIKVELIWQQWARVYDYLTFTPAWTGSAAKEFLTQVRGRVPVIVHSELTDFGRHIVTPAEFHRTLRASHVPGVIGLDFYSGFLADGKKAWPAIRRVYKAVGSARPIAPLGDDTRVLILYDDPKKAGLASPLHRMFAVNVANLLGHFPVTWETRRVESYRRGDLAGYAAVFYIGTVYGNTPEAFVSDVSVFDRPVVWIGQNLYRLRASGVNIPFTQRTADAVSGFNILGYRDRTLPARGEVIRTTVGAGATVLATLRARSGTTTPFLMRAKNLWYVAGNPLTHLDAPNGRYLAFADMLHDVLGSRVGSSAKAFLRIEDVDPLADPAQLRAIADLFARKRAPFMVAVVPFHVDPARDRRISLSERPKVVEALKYIVERGGSLILHGSTHQYRGRTGLDYEFWIPESASGVPVDGEPYVREKLDSALHEMWRNDLHPVAWETPHYAATPFDYSLFGEYFSTFVERRVYGVHGGKAFVQPLPYTIEKDVYGGRILPENIGFVRSPVDVKAMVAAARDARVVRDAVAGGFIHPTVPLTAIARLIDDLFGLGYTFLDLYDLPNLVSTARRVEVTGYGWATAVVPSGWHLRETFFARDGDPVRSRLAQQPSYARVTRSFPDVPYGGIYSMQVLERAGDGGLFSASGVVAIAGAIVLGVSLVLASVGVILLVLSYGRIKVQRAGVIAR